MALAKVIVVDDPQRHGSGSTSFVSYRLTFHSRSSPTTSSAAGADSPGARSSAASTSSMTVVTAEVRRRYSDFEALHQYLSREYPTCIIPPLPSKKRFDYLDRFADQFIRKRMRGLQRFSNWTLSHHLLGVDRAVLEFFTRQDWHAPTSSTATTSDTGVAVGPSSTDLIAERLMNALTKVKNPRPEFQQIQQNLQLYQENITSTEKYLGRFVKCQAETGAAYHTIAGEFETSWSLFTDVNGEGNVESLASWVQCMHTLGDLFTSTSSKNEEVVLESLHDQLAYCRAMKTTLKQRDLKQIEYESLQDYLEQTRKERNQLLMSPNGSLTSTSNLKMFLKEKYVELKGGNADQLRQERIRTLELREMELQRAFEQSQYIENSFSLEVKKEAEKFESTLKAEELTDMVRSLANHEVTFLETALKQLDLTIETLESDLAEHVDSK